VWLMMTGTKNKFGFHRDNEKERQISQNSEKGASNRTKYSVEGKVDKEQQNKERNENSPLAMEKLIKVNDRIKQLTACESTEEII
jgi:hypothetical protein